jgi:hypothetical protein
MSDEREDAEWQRLCKLVADERNPQRLSELIDQLIKALDAHRNALRGGKQPSEAASVSGPDSANDYE